jgi:putative ABC transport system substrate-binding protein
MTTNIVVFVSTCFLVTVLATLAEGQTAKKLPQVGYLSASSPAEAAQRTEAFRKGLHELGYVDGKNISVRFLYAEGKFDRLPELARELVHLKVDAIVTAGPSVTHPVRKATSTIPIIMTNDSDPVGSGFVASLARPGGNVTGLTSLAQELSSKRLEILKDVVPKLSRVAILGTSDIPGNAQAVKESELAAAALGVDTHYLDIRVPTDIEPALGQASKRRADALLVLNGPPHLQQRIPPLVAQRRLPAIYSTLAIMNDRGLMSYGASVTDLDRRAAIYVDKILKGAKPGDLPVEQPTKFELVINLGAAKQIGLIIPPNILARADRVIR